MARPHRLACLHPVQIPRDDKDAPWAYGSLGVHERPEDQEDLVPALDRAVRTVLRKVRRSDVRWTDPVVFCYGNESDEVQAAVRAVAARLGWPYVTTPRH